MKKACSREGAGFLLFRLNTTGDWAHCPLTGLLEAWGSSTAHLHGGVFQCSIFALDSSQISISGGSIIGCLLSTDRYSRLIIDSFDFAVDGVPVGPGELTSILGGATQFTKAIEEMNCPVHLLNSANDLVGLSLKIAKEKYQDSRV